MTKEQYLKVRDLEQIPMDVWYEYYTDRGGVLGFDDFQHVFSIVLWNNPTTDVRGVTKHITFKGALDNFYAYYNHKFKLGSWDEKT